MRIRSIARARHRNPIWLIASASIVIFACAPLFVPVSPTLDPDSVKTAIAGTAAAAETMTALLTPPTWTPTFTPFPTGTSPSTPTPTETFFFSLPTFTRTRTPTSIPTQTSPPDSGGGGGNGNSKLSCNVTGVNPSNNTVFSPNQDFDTQWTLKNTGSDRWEASGMDYVFVGGDSLHTQSGYDLPGNVKSGAMVTLGVDMKAPGTPGTYSTTWNLKAGKTFFCNMRLTIIVQ